MGITKLSKSGFTSSSYEKYNDFLAGNTAFSPSSYESIATVTVGSGGASDVTFSSISSGYTHLQLRFLARNTRSFTSDFYYIQFNGDTGNNYAAHILMSSGSSVSTAAYANTSVITNEQGIADTSTANCFSASVFDILDYKDTNKFKTTRWLQGWDANGSGYVTFSSGLWRNTNAITSIKLFPNVGSWVQYSQFALYGIKGVA
jgi:hypothetical protein